MYTIYLRKEKQVSEGWTRPVVAYYRAPHFDKPFCINPWESRPTYRNKYVMYNCVKYKVVWLPEKSEVETQL